MEANLKVLFIDPGSGFYKLERFPVGDFFGPVDLGLHLAGKHASLNIGAGLFAGSILPGTNRLVFTGFSPCWGGFFVSSMGGAALTFDNLGVNMISLLGKAPRPSVLYLNRVRGEEIQVEVSPVDVTQRWKEGRGGIYSLMDSVWAQYGDRYENDPRILAVGPASRATDFGAIGSVPIVKGKLTFVDTWAGRGGLGTKLLRDHGVAAVIYGGTFIDEDFTNRSVADQWFEDRYRKKLAAKDFEATVKYRFDPAVGTGGTFGVNFATLGGRMLAFNYGSIHLDEAERRRIHDKFVLQHYLRQFNEETIVPRHQRNCGEPCVAVCKKMNEEFKKDYEPYQALGPLCGIFDQRAAEKLNHQADRYGFDAIAAGGVLSWLMECLAKGLLSPGDLGVPDPPVFSAGPGFSVETDSMHNADVGVALLDAIIEKRGLLDLGEGARKLARHLAREEGKEVLDLFVYAAFGRKGWMVPNQYWTPGVLSPMAIMGKYYMYYGADFVPPRELGRKNAERFRRELLLDNLGVCRFHRHWADEMLPEIVGSLYGLKDQLLRNTVMTASRIHSRNASVFWESERNIDFIHTFLKRSRDVDGSREPELLRWIDEFEKDRREAALAFWYEIHKGAHESLREF
jgi:glyceraldehyde-3-phosphate dehydrogenase (ferredoxin)